jgi:signal transduction histidine kinase
MTPKRHSLPGRVVLIIVGSVIATSLIFGLAALGLAYTTEDRVFHRALAEEVRYQKLVWARSGALPAPRNPDVAIYRQDETLPSDIRQEFAESRRQTEFYGREGRHYHIQRFDLNDGRSGTDPAPAVAVLEVSKDLLIRPYRDSILAVLVALSLIIAAFMAGLGWWLVNWAVKPLSALARDVADADSAVPTIEAQNYPPNEIGTLAEALEQAFARIRGFVDRERTFTRDASHELRTPLAVVLGAAEVIALDRDLPTHYVEPLRRIETAATDMKLALDQLLALARENEGVLKESVALRPMIAKAIAWSQARYPDSEITVSTDVDKGAVVLVHPTSLQLVLNNLIGNCFQHVGTGQLVIKFGNGCLSIADDGPGFQVGADPFAPFAKSDASIGSGLGLDISRRLCDAAGIGLTAGQREDGRGALFRLKF